MYWAQATASTKVDWTKLPITQKIIILATLNILTPSTDFQSAAQAACSLHSIFIFYTKQWNEHNATLKLYYSDQLSKAVKWINNQIALESPRVQCELSSAYIEGQTLLSHSC